MRKGDFQKTIENEIAGELVLRLRERLGLTQEEFGNYVHVRWPHIVAPTQGTVSQWESGDATVPSPLLVHAIEELGIAVVTIVLDHRDKALKKCWINDHPERLDLLAA